MLNMSESYEGFFGSGEMTTEKNFPASFWIRGKKTSKINKNIFLRAQAKLASNFPSFNFGSIFWVLWGPFL